jgi:hypothetical protein
MGLIPAVLQHLWALGGVGVAFLFIFVFLFCSHDTPDAAG